MKKLIQVATLAVTLLACTQFSYAQTKVCCACNGVGQFFSTAFIPGTTNPETITTYCSLCSGTGAGNCVRKATPAPSTLPPGNRPGDTKIYLDYLMKLVDCKNCRPTPQPAEFWRTRPDLNLPPL